MKKKPDIVLTKDAVAAIFDKAHLTKHQAGLAGIIWPPASGWKKKLVGRKLPYHVAIEFAQGRYDFDNPTAVEPKRSSKKQQKYNRALEAAKEFEETSRIASRCGMLLRKCSPLHYQVSGKEGWLMNLWVTTGTIHIDLAKPLPPIVDDFGSQWSLLDVVDRFVCFYERQAIHLQETALEEVNEMDHELRAITSS